MPTGGVTPTPIVVDGSDAAAVHPTAGGRLRAQSGTLEVALPSGAVDEPVVVRAQAANERGRGRVKVARAFRLTAETATGRRVSRFQSSLTISASYTPAELKAAGLREDELGVYHLNETTGAWDRLPSTVDRGARRVIGSVAHFSVFAVGGETFETAGGSGSSWSDNFSDFTAWTLVSGTLVGGGPSGGILTMTGNKDLGDDIAVVNNTSAYTDLSYQVALSDQGSHSSHKLGLLIHYTDTNNYYFAYMVNGNSLGLDRKQGGTLTTLSTASQAYSDSTFYWLKVVISGSTITVYFADDVSGSPGTYTQKIQVTDSTLPSGAIGLMNKTSTTQDKNARFRAPGVSMTLPQDWNAITQTTGHPGVIWDKVTVAHGGTGSLQMFSGHSSFVGYAAQTTNNSVTGGTRMRVTGWIKTTNVTTGGSNGAKIILVEQPSGTQTVLATQTGTQGWTQYQTTISLLAGTTSLQVRAHLQGSGTANFDDIKAEHFLTMTLSTTTAPFGTTLKPTGANSDQAAVGAGYADGNNGAYYVRDRAGSSYAVTVTVDSSRAWTGSVSATENGGTAGMRISTSSLRWKLGDASNLTEAQGGVAFTTTANSSVFNTASACSLGSTLSNGTCTYDYDYILQVRWADAPGTFSTTVTYSASQ